KWQVAPEVEQHQGVRVLEAARRARVGGQDLVPPGNVLGGPPEWTAYRRPPPGAAVVAQDVEPEPVEAEMLAGAFHLHVARLVVDIAEVDALVLEHSHGDRGAARVHPQDGDHLEPVERFRMVEGRVRRAALPDPAHGPKL